MKPWTTHPAVATLPVLARATGLLFIAIGVLALASSYLNDWEAGEEAAIQVLGAGSCLIGLLIFTMGSDRLPRSAYHLWIVIASVLVITLVGLAQGRGGPVGTPALGFLVVIDVFFIFSRFAALAHLTFLCLGQGWVLDRAGFAGVNIGMLFGMYAATGLIVAWLSRMGDSVERDPLTGLANRRGHERLLLESLDQVARDGGQLSLVLLDLDHFKQVNDTLGHLAGDQLLVRCANAWRSRLGPHQTLTRFGGDEFCLVLPHCSLGRAADLADELRRLAPEGVGVSAGVASWNHGDSASKLMSRADVALYDAKEAGRNTTAAYGDPQRQASELEGAIADEQLHMVFQPIVQLSDRQPVSCEALVRWEHPERGSLSPAEFIPMAERTGAIHALGAWTLDQACASAVTGAFGGLAVSVNVSIPELRHPDYHQFVASTLYTHALAPERLIVEVTEAVFDEDDPQVVLSLKRLRALGVQVALDDFGAGYSSLRWLERFPLDIVKVDRSFVEGLGTDREQAPVLEAILRIGAALGFRVIVEGVETEAQAAALAQLGGLWAQGYYFGAPVPLPQLRRRSAASSSPEAIDLRDRFASPT